MAALNPIQVEPYMYIDPLILIIITKQENLSFYTIFLNK